MRRARTSGADSCGRDRSPTAITEDPRYAFPPVPCPLPSATRRCRSCFAIVAATVSRSSPGIGPVSGCCTNGSSRASAVGLSDARLGSGLPSCRNSWTRHRVCPAQRTRRQGSGPDDATATPDVVRRSSPPDICRTFWVRSCGERFGWELARTGQRRACQCCRRARVRAGRRGSDRPSGGAVDPARA